MSQHISTKDSIWDSLREQTGKAFVASFREKMSKDPRLFKLAKDKNASPVDRSRCAFGIFEAYLYYISPPARNRPLPGGHDCTKRHRKDVPGGHGKSLPKNHREIGIPRDPSEPISALLAAMALREYQPAIEVIRTMEGSFRVSYEASDFADVLSNITELERQYVHSEPITDEDNDPDGSAYIGAFLQDLASGMDEPEVRIRANLIRDRSKLFAYAKIADQINQHINEVIANSPPATFEILTQADREVFHRPPLRRLRIFSDWFGENVVSLQLETGMRLSNAIERLSALLAAHYGWMEEHAMVFVFAGVAPPTGGIRVHYRMRGDIPCQSRIVLEIDPAIPEETVTQLYKLARRHVLPRGSKPKAIGAKMMALAQHAYGYGPGGNIDEAVDAPKFKMRRWNERIAPHLKNLKRTAEGAETVQNEAKYAYQSRFIADCRRAFECLIRPKYRTVNSEGYFISGTELPARHLLKPADESE